MQRIGMIERIEYKSSIRELQDKRHQAHDNSMEYMSFLFNSVQALQMI